MKQLKLVGSYGSPYSRKMRAVLRYRRIPFRWIPRGSADDVGIPPVPVALIPVLVFSGGAGEDDTGMIDSTFQIRRLEELYHERTVIPSDPGVAFLDALVEDYADEWLTKAMFHYRWKYAPDIAKASRVLPLERGLDLSSDALAEVARFFSDRQIGRLAVVGSNETTTPVIEASYRRLLELLDAHLAVEPFVFGARPGAGDFGLFGQLSQLAQFDPTSTALAVEVAPRVVAWVVRLEDLSWLEADGSGWTGLNAIPPTVRAIFGEIGRVYAPFLLANEAALESGVSQVECTIDGARWVQRPFPYQAKCLRWLREGYSALDAESRRFVDGVLEGTGCGVLFARRGS